VIVRLENRFEVAPISNVVFLVDNVFEVTKVTDLDAERAYLEKKLEKGNWAMLRQGAAFKLVVKTSVNTKSTHANLEKIRQTASEVFDVVDKEELEEINIMDFQSDKDVVHAFLEAFLLSSYTFQKYKSEKKETKLAVIRLYSPHTSPEEFVQIQNLCEAVQTARDWVNEPLISFTAEDFGDRTRSLGKEKGFKVTVFDKQEIEKLKMGGLLAINAGSPNPPTFTVAEYKPVNAVNNKPIVLIGKGVVYDTGGLSLKPTPNSMDYMKCDMAGGAVAIGIISAIAANQFPLHVISIVPATENRLDGNAITPGDVVTMYNGKTVEILNTDAEGRVILADALSYAKQFDPELVMDLATLTGSAVAAIGNKGIVYLGTASQEIKDKLETVGFQTHERLVELPLWEEYGKYLESDIADIKNIGGSDSGAISAAKFLEFFVDYPWLHFDIAAMSFAHQKDSYRGKGGTGVGIRLVYQFLKSHYLSL
jgi:leucyl aminopeptidase